MDVVKEKIKYLKNRSGSHSPSISTLLDYLPEIEIKIDACFLSNPYATDLFIGELNELINNNGLRKILEFYPPQNQDISIKISKVINTQSENIFVGNGAIEVIQACMHRFANKNIAIPIPTFSSYYEYLLDDRNVFFYNLSEENDYLIDIEDYSKFIMDNKIDSAIIINPNNPVGCFLTFEKLIHFLENNTHLDLIIIDESFIHFAYEGHDKKLIDNSFLVEKYPNLILIKSMSKDFGIAGIRAGYGIMSRNRVSDLLKNGYLWNISGIADFFFDLYCKKEFQKDYERVRKTYINETELFFKELSNNNYIKVYPSKANFALIKIPSDISSFDFCVDLLVRDGVYLRDCSDKIGLNGNCIRVASRTFNENQLILHSINSYFSRFKI